jgi:hypothetical protein
MVPRNGDGFATLIPADGPFLKDRGEQELLVDLLQRTDADIAWPTADVIKNLVNEWGW